MFFAMAGNAPRHLARITNKVRAGCSRWGRKQDNKMNAVATSQQIPLIAEPRLYSVSEFKIAKMREMTIDNPVLDSPQNVRNFFREHIEKSDLYRPEVENFVVLFLNTRRR